MNTAVNNAALSGIQPEPGTASLSDHDIRNLIAIWEAIAKLDPDPQEKLIAELRIEQLKAMRRH